MKTPPKWVIYGSVIGGGGALIYAYVKKKNAANAAAAQNSVANVYGYGNTSAYGYQGYQGSLPEQPYGYGAYTYDPYGYAYGMGGYPGGAYAGYQNTNTTQQPTTATTNAQWSLNAINGLKAQGYNAQTVTNALGAYIEGRPVNAQQEQVIDAAIAVAGYPPVDGQDGYPPAIRTQSSGNKGGQNDIDVPNVKGQSQEAAFAILAAAGLHATGTPIQTGQTLIVQSQSPPAGARVKPGTTVRLTSKKQRTRDSNGRFTSSGQTIFTGGAPSPEWQPSGKIEY